MTRFLSLIAAFVLVGVGVGGCGDSGDANEDATSDTSGGQHVAITLTKAACDPATVTVPVGEVALDVTNGDTTDDARFSIRRGETVVGELDTLGPGEELTLRVDLEVGEYVMDCPGDSEGRVVVGSGDLGPDMTQPPTGY